jgi:hypothetical protein
VALITSGYSSFVPTACPYERETGRVSVIQGQDRGEHLLPLTRYFDRIRSSRQRRGKSAPQSSSSTAAEFPALAPGVTMLALWQPSRDAPAQPGLRGRRCADLQDAHEDHSGQGDRAHHRNEGRRCNPAADGSDATDAGGCHADRRGGRRLKFAEPRPHGGTLPQRSESMSARTSR